MELGGVVMKVFVYGTLKKGFGNNSLMESAEAKFICETTTKKEYYLVSYGIPYVVKETKEYPRSIRKMKGKIKGELYEIPEKNIGIIDDLEGHPNWYRRELVELENGEKAYLYFMDLDLEENKENLVKPKKGILEYRRVV